MRFGLVVSTLLVCPIFSMPAAADTKVDLSALHGWDIVIPADAHPAVRYAAEEFRDHYARATAIRLPIVEKADGPSRHVFIGTSDAMRASGAAFDTSTFGPEQLRILLRDGNIAIAGGSPRGTLYGVYTFLEDYLGVRFLTPDHTHVPRDRDGPTVDSLDHAYEPPFGFRWGYYGETNKDSVFAARMRCNTIPDEDRLGGKSGRILINHTFGRQIPSKEHGASHPEYYCLIDGERRATVDSDWHENEPCLTNPEVLRIVTDAVLEEIAEHPQRTNVVVGQNDNDKYCRCDKCAEIDGREGTPMGSLLTFVNAVAGEVAAEHPDVKVGTLAYWYTRKPPAHLKPAPNVQFQLCSIECSVMQPINDPECELNVAFCRDFEAWSELSDDICIWNYNTNFRNFLLPCPNLRVIEPNIRFFLSRKVEGVFMQGAHSRGAEMSGLRNYMTSRLLWDPTLSGGELMDEFLTLHYRSAAPPIRRFIDLVHDNAEKLGIEKNCFGNASDYGIDARIAAAGIEAFEEAMDLADDQVVRDRVEKASACAYRAAMEDAWLWVREHGKDPEKLKLPPDIAARTRPHTRRLMRLCARHGITNWSEGMTIEEAEAQLRKAYDLGEDEAF